VILFTTTVDFQGSTVDAIRVKIPKAQPTSYATGRSDPVLICSKKKKAGRTPAELTSQKVNTHDDTPSRTCACTPGSMTPCAPPAWSRRIPHRPAVHPFPGLGKKRSNRAAWCLLFADGDGGVFGDWSTGLSEVWHSDQLQEQNP
jgi:hypothetical protein